MRLVFDIETNGLLPKVDTIHCIVAFDIDTQEVHQFGPSAVDAGLDFINKADLLVGHNICGFDLPVIQHVKGVDLRGIDTIDTIAVSRAIFVSTLRDADFKRLRHGFPKQLVGRHSLESWGHRLGCEKGEFALTTDWQEFSQEMLDYCVQDVRVNARLFQFLTDFERLPGNPAMPLDAMITESRVHGVMGEQERHGVGFDEEGAVSLVARLQDEKAVLTGELQGIYRPEWISQGQFTPKRPNKTRGYAKGGTCTKISLREFNPGSDLQIGERLQARGWLPAEFTPGGAPKVDESALSTLDPATFTGVDLLLRYKLVDQRLGQIWEGKSAWLKKSRASRLHGRVMATGTRTGRMSASSPNLQQVPRVGSYMGAECRRLFGPGDKGWLVGCDASGLELRTLANRMSQFDGGKFAKDVIEGDIHETMRLASGLHSRNNQKTFTYAMLYGAGATKLGQTVSKDLREAGLPVEDDEATLGKRVHSRLVSKLSGLRELLAAAKAAHQRGFIRLLDGRFVQSVSEHSALNTLLQGDGAVVMKNAQFMLDKWLREERVDHAFNLTVHDEFQIETHRREDADIIGQRAVDAIRLAGRGLGMRVELDAEYVVGRTWEDTH